MARRARRRASALGHPAANGLSHQRRAPRSGKPTLTSAARRTSSILPAPSASTGRFPPSALFGASSQPPSCRGGRTLSSVSRRSRNRRVLDVVEIRASRRLVILVDDWVACTCRLDDVVHHPVPVHHQNFWRVSSSAPQPSRVARTAASTAAWSGRTFCSSMAPKRTHDQLSHRARFVTKAEPEVIRSPGA